MRTITGSRRLAVVVLVGTAAVGLACAGLVMSPYILNNRALHRQSSQLDDVDLPAGTVEVARHDEVGLQVCCSNHCDFFTGRTLDSPLEPDAMRAAIPHPELDLVPVSEVEEPLLAISGFVRLQAKSGGAPTGHRYYLYRFEQTYEGFAFEGDLRCH